MWFIVGPAALVGRAIGPDYPTLTIFDITKPLTLIGAVRVGTDVHRPVLANWWRVPNLSALHNLDLLLRMNRGHSVNRWNIRYLLHTLSALFLIHGEVAAGVYARTSLSHY